MKQRLALLPGRRLHLIRDRAEPLAIEPRRRRELLGKRGDDGTRSVGCHLVAQARVRQRLFGE